MNLNLKETRDKYDNKVSQYQSLLRDGGINLSVSNSDFVTEVENTDPIKDHLNRRMAVIGLIMIWEDYVLDIYEMLDRGIVKSKGSILLKMRNRGNIKSFNLKRYIEKYDYIRLYRNHILHNNCQKSFEYDWNVLRKQVILLKTDGELSLEDNAIKYIFDSVEALKNDIDSDVFV